MTLLRTAVWGLLFAPSLSGPATAQEIGNLSAPVTKSKVYVVYQAEPQVIAAGKQTVMELRFQVANGFHVNSHKPKSELLIPTRLTLQGSPGVQTGVVGYPPGLLYSFSFDPTNKLDVYSGAFALKLPVAAAAGPHTINAVLSYQACDHAACYPPKSLPVQLVFTAK